MRSFIISVCRYRHRKTDAFFNYIKKSKKYRQQSGKEILRFTQDDTGSVSVFFGLFGAVRHAPQRCHSEAEPKNPAESEALCYLTSQ